MGYLIFHLEIINGYLYNPSALMKGRTTGHSISTNMLSSQETFAAMMASVLPLNMFVMEFNIVILEKMKKIVK